MKAITTKYHGPTATRSARVTATDGDNRASVEYGNFPSNEHAHDGAAIALCKKLEWEGTLLRGHAKAGNVYVWLRFNFRVTDENDIVTVESC